jgi:hypothetical protein
MPRLEADLGASRKAGNGPRSQGFKTRPHKVAPTASSRALAASYRIPAVPLMNGGFSLGSGEAVQDRTIEHVEVSP